MKYINSRGVTYLLHGREVSLRNGKPSRIYYFRKVADRQHYLANMPSGMEVAESPNGLPVLRKIKVVAA